MASAGSSCATPGSRTRTSCGRPTRPRRRARPLLDPNALSDDGTTALSAVEVTRERGADRLRHQRRRLRLADLGACAGSRPGRTCLTASAGASSHRRRGRHDDAGFFYGRYPEPPADAAYDAPNRAWSCATTASAPTPPTIRLVFATPDQPEWGFEPEVTDDGRLLVLSVWRGTDPDNRVYVADLDRRRRGRERSAAARRGRCAATSRSPASNGTLYLLTDLRCAAWPRRRDRRRRSGRAARGRPGRRPTRSRQVRLVGERLAAVSLHDAHHRLAIFETDGRHVADVALPGIGTIAELAGRRDDTELFLTFMTFAAPAGRPRRADGDGRLGARGRAAGAALGSGRLRHRAGLRHLRRRDPDAPSSSRHRRDVVPSGDVPTLLYGYGGFQISVGPTFKPSGWPGWSAAACWRSPRCAAAASTAAHGTTPGGSSDKQNVFDDFAACARWLAASGWTDAPQRIGISGRSNGGLLVGAALTQHPELFGAAVAEVG